MKQKLFYLFIGITLLLLGFASAAPNIPHQFYGSVTVNGDAALETNIIVAAVGGDYYTTITTKGFYGNSPNIFYIEDPDGTRVGDTISFYLGGRVIKGAYDFRGVPVGTATFTANGLTKLNIETTTTCSDGYCIGDETCSTCSSDCGICTDPPIITIGSPINTVYNTHKIDLTVTSDQNIIMWLYSLNGADPITFTPDIIITGAYDEETGKGDNTLTVIGINDQFQSGTSTVAFTVELPVSFCGDFVCDASNGETCSTCSIDCGSCGGGGGGGSGGGSSGGGGGGGSSATSSNSTNVTEEVLVASEETPKEANTDAESEEKVVISEKRFNIFSWLTGAATGNGAGSNWWVAVIIVVVLVAILVFVWKKRRATKNN